MPLLAVLLTTLSPYNASLLKWGSDTLERCQGFPVQTYADKY